MTDASKRLGAQGWTNGAPPVGQIVEVLQSLDNLSVVRALWTGKEWRTQAGMLLAGVVRWKPCEKYDTLQVESKHCHSKPRTDVRVSG